MTSLSYCFTSPCIVWPKYKDQGGYGQRKFRGKMMLAHRAAWIEAAGEVPVGLCVLHRCDNPSCVNVEHLRLGTHADNMRDMALKNRSPNRKITPLEAIEIAESKDRLWQISDKFGISQQHASDIRRGKRWQYKAEQAS